MDSFISSDVPLDKISSAVDAYIDALPQQKSSKLKKRKDEVGEAIYNKPSQWLAAKDKECDFSKRNKLIYCPLFLFLKFQKTRFFPACLCLI